MSYGAEIESLQLSISELKDEVDRDMKNESFEELLKTQTKTLEDQVKIIFSLENELKELKEAHVNQINEESSVVLIGQLSEKIELLTAAETTLEAALREKEEACAEVVIQLEEAIKERNVLETLNFNCAVSFANEKLGLEDKVNALIKELADSRKIIARLNEEKGATSVHTSVEEPIGVKKGYATEKISCDDEILKARSPSTFTAESSASPVASPHSGSSWLGKLLSPFSTDINSGMKSPTAEDVSETGISSCTPPKPGKHLVESQVSPYYRTIGIPTLDSEGSWLRENEKLRDVLDMGEVQNLETSPSSHLPHQESQKLKPRTSDEIVEGNYNIQKLSCK